MSDWRARLLALARAGASAVTGVTGVTDVSDLPVQPVTSAITSLVDCCYASYGGYTPDCYSDREQHDIVVTGSATVLDEDELSERAAIAEYVGGVPAEYAWDFAALQLLCPLGMDVVGWLQTIDDAARFLDQWGLEAKRLGWRPEELFAPDGLIRALKCKAVTALTPAGAALSNGRIFNRTVEPNLL